jgi:predicted NBD/HSP70 family sugar kinase
MQFSQQRFDRSDIRQLNTISSLNQLHRNGPQSRAQIASALGLTRATVSKIAQDLLDVNLLVETHLTEGGAGRPGMLLNLNGSFGCLLAVEIDLDRVSIALADFNRAVFWEDECGLEPGARAAESLEMIAALMDEALAAGDARGLPCLGIGVAWAGLVAHESGRLVYGPSSGWKDIPLKSLWEERYAVPVYVENEANAAAIGWQSGGAGRDGFARSAGSDLIYLSLGAGLAAGIISGGRLLRGKTGFAGQVGHVPFKDNGVTCSCGRKGCWVTEIGASAVLRKLESAGLSVTGGSKAQGDPLDSILKRAADGEARVIEVLSDVGEQLARGAAQLVQTFNPATLILGGRLGELFVFVEDSIRDSLSALALPGLIDNLDFQVSATKADPLKGSLAIVHDAILGDPYRLNSLQAPSQRKKIPR